ncbi:MULTISPECIES: hypothetical protein [Paenibacillus]|uniref:hypothetical protein n=1 Tax=Paenibacillus TaxID=44249 RepID=UPI002FE36E06
MQQSVLFIVSSTIYLTSQPLSYSATRSAFTIEERARQTLGTIASIRDKFPAARILLIETGLRPDVPPELTQSADRYLYLGHRKIIRQAADGPYKGLGEALSLYLANRAIRSFQADYYFKLSGRYYLDDHFDPQNWVGETVMGRECGSGLYTVLYGFPRRLYDNWRSSLRQSIPVLLRGESLELIQPKFFEKPIRYLPRLGVSGWKSHSGEFVSL